MEAGSSETRVHSAPSHPIDAGGFAPGTILVDRYRIVSLAGRGGMGEVYRADDLRLGQPVALKFLPASLEHDAAARERLLAEVRSARTVSHPNVCCVYDVGELAGPALSERPSMNSGQPEPAEGRSESKGRVFLTMEYIDGEDLASLLRRIGKLPAAKALEVARQLCAGLAAAHDKGLLHRDLKPANVMIDGRGQARITDFGLAVEATPAGAPADYAGTLAYMAPERFAGKPATVQSDLYALGLILYETYTGKPAFKASSLLEWQQAHSDSTPTSPSALATDMEPAVERAILRCLEKDPGRRPASAGQVARALPGCAPARPWPCCDEPRPDPCGSAIGCAWAGRAGRLFRTAPPASDNALC
jgi:serine/threonine protein kinase